MIPYNSYRYFVSFKTEQKNLFKIHNLLLSTFYILGNCTYYMFRVHKAHNPFLPILKKKKNVHNKLIS